MSPEKTNLRPELEERLRFKTLIADLSLALEDNEKSEIRVKAGIRN
jgi:hypothetical protein